MARVRTALLQTGQTLAADVKDAQGQLVIRSGVMLADRHLELLKKWHISEVEIEGSTGVEPAPVGGETMTTPSLPAETAARVEQAKESLRNHFRHTNLQDLTVREFFEICALRKAKVAL
jgi:hypothetical protein